MTGLRLRIPDLGGENRAMASEYGKKYPGSGGAGKRPRTGGADWVELPPGTFEEVPITHIEVEKNSPSLIRRLRGERTTYTEVEVVDGYETRKRYH